MRNTLKNHLNSVRESLYSGSFRITLWMNSTERKLNLIIKRLDIIEAKLDHDNKTSLEDYVTEQEAKKLLKRGTTWFWELRRAGLPYSKLGGQVYYKISDLKSLLEKGTESLL